MAYLVAYFDESGKFRDHDLISFAGFMADPYAWEHFNAQWRALLRQHGLAALHAVKALRFAGPLSTKMPAKGLDARLRVLDRFISAIQLHVEFGVACVVDASAFRSLDDRRRRTLKDPQYVAFRCVLGEMGAHVSNDDAVSLMCDDEEHYSVECYKIFTGIRKADHRVRRHFISIGFGDDYHFPQLQAADLFARLLRLDAERKFAGKANHFQAVFDNLMTQKPTSKLQIIGKFCDGSVLRELCP
jgi:hypothetical protein